LSCAGVIPTFDAIEIFNGAYSNYFGNPNVDHTGNLARFNVHDGVRVAPSPNNADYSIQGLAQLVGEAIEKLELAPAIIDFSTPGHAYRVRAFRLNPLDTFVLHRGAWHYGPFPLGAEPVRLLNLQGRRYEEDSAYVDLDEVTGMRVTVRIKE